MAIEKQGLHLEARTASRFMLFEMTWRIVLGHLLSSEDLVTTVAVRLQTREPPPAKNSSVVRL